MTIRNGFLIFTAAACIWPAQGQEQPKQEQPKQEQPKEVVGKPGAKEIFLSRQIPYIDPDEKPAPAKPEKSTAGTKVKPKLSDRRQRPRPCGDGLRKRYGARRIKAIQYPGRINHGIPVGIQSNRRGGALRDD